MGLPAHLIESLEDRRLLSASILVKDGTLIVRGTPRADEIIVSDRLTFQLDLVQPALFVTINGRTRRLDQAGIRRIRVEAGAGDDSVVMSDVSYGVALGAPTRFSEPFPATILGGSGDDRLVGGNFADFISGGPGRDFLSGGDGDDTLEGDANSDTLGGNNGNDLLRGGAGDDRFIETDGDRAFGGDGVDIAGIDTVFESRATPPPQGSSIEAYGDVLDAALPRFDISRQGTLTIFGTRRSDVLHLEYFSEVSPIHYLLDVNGHSISIGAYPAKRIQIETGDGDDTMLLEEEVETTIHSAGATPIFVPVTMLGGNGNDSLIGGIGSDFLDGGAGDDFLAGSGGNDTLDGGDGDDTLHGDPGTDLLRNGESNLQGPDLTDFVVN